VPIPLVDWPPTVRSFLWTLIIVGILTGVGIDLRGGGIASEVSDRHAGSSGLPQASAAQAIVVSQSELGTYVRRDEADRAGDVDGE
jgi:hypothetical protein